MRRLGGAEPRIRRAKVSDLAALEALYDELHLKDYMNLRAPRPRIRRQFQRLSRSRDHHLLVAEVSGRVVGTAHVINYVSHSLVPTIEPVAHLCASGVLERFPDIRFAAIESGIGWVAWALEAMDEAYFKHHMWAFPKLKMRPSGYFHAHGFASFQEDKVGLDLALKYNLADNFLWANDYPHHEGSWPHSAQAIERQMNDLDDGARAKILGLNAARLWKFDVEKLLGYRNARRR